MKFGRTIVLQMHDGISGRVLYKEPFTFKASYREFDNAFANFTDGASDAFKDLISDYENEQKIGEIDETILVRILQNRGYIVTKYRGSTDPLDYIAP